MPITIHPAGYAASGTSYSTTEPKNGSEMLKDIFTSMRRVVHGKLIQSSFKSDDAPKHFTADSNGFVSGAMRAYNEHHHLVIRPEDIWLAILTQLSSYVNAHAEELRGTFVEHEGKVELEIRYPKSLTEYTVDWADFSTRIVNMMEDKIVDPELRDWIRPAFSTTTEHDIVVSNIVMMASMQAYFEYTCSFMCGLPSVTLLGEKADYELILRRLNKLRSYGDEPTQFASLLEPVVKRFITSFDKPENKEIIDFWNRIFKNISLGSMGTYCSGWITAFTFWDRDGKALNTRRGADADDTPLILDGQKYHTVEDKDVPPGFCTVPVKIDKDDRTYEAEMLAGSIGWDWVKSEECAARGDGLPDTVKPRTGWFIYEKFEEICRLFGKSQLSESENARRTF